MVLVYSDDKKLTLELLNKATELAKELHKKVIAVTIGHEEFAKELVEHGADLVIVVETSLHQFKAEEYTSILQTIMKDHGNEIVLIGSNKNGKELAARLAAKLDAGCVMDCIKVYLHDKKLYDRADRLQRKCYRGRRVHHRTSDPYHPTKGLRPVTKK